MQKNAKNPTFFYKERKRMQRMLRSFIKNPKERKRMQKNAKNATFFYKERKKMQRTPHSFIKNTKECKKVAFFWKEHKPNPEKKTMLSATVNN